MNRIPSSTKFILALGIFALVLALLQLLRQQDPQALEQQVLVSNLLPPSDEPVQFGAILTPEKATIGELVTLTIVLRNNGSDSLTPRLNVTPPTNLRLETGVSEELLINNADQTIHWYPSLATGDTAVQEIQFLAFRPTNQETGNYVVVRFNDAESSHQLQIPFWAGLSIKPTADFAITDQHASVAQQIQFMNESSGQPPLSYLWEFGDGTISTEANPVHTYPAAGEYAVSLTTRNQLGEAQQTQSILVGMAPTLRVLHDDTIFSGASFILQAFTNGSEDEIVWDMGDGTRRTGYWIEHSYAASGQYVVVINARNAYGNTVLTKLVDVQPGQPKATAVVPTVPAAADKGSPPAVTLDAIQLTANSAVDVQPLSNQLLYYINAARQQAGLAPLEWSNRLSQAAQLHTDDMAARFIAGHIGSDGSTPYDRIAQSEYVAGYFTGEATAWGFNSARAAVQFWLDSPLHREIILNPEADQVGAAETTNYDAPYAWYWTAEFASYQIPSYTPIYSPGPGYPTPIIPATATATTTPSPSATPVTLTPTLSPTVTTATATPTPTLSPTPSLTPTITNTPTMSPTPTVSATATTPLSPTATATVTRTTMIAPSLGTGSFNPNPFHPINLMPSLVASFSLAPYQEEKSYVK